VSKRNPRAFMPGRFQFKVNQIDARAKLVKDIAQGRTNMHTMFMSLAASSLRVGGRFVSITPRSFGSGTYFRPFRQQFFSTILIRIFYKHSGAGTTVLQYMDWKYRQGL